MDLLELAKSVATRRHSGDFHGVLPYTHHLQDVHYVLLRYDTKLNLDPDLFVAAWLHEIIEKTRMPKREVEELFGEKIANWVDAVTPDGNPHRAVSNSLSYPVIRMAGPEAVRLKLADRVADLEAGNRLRKVFEDEYGQFRTMLYTSGSNEDLWAKLDSLLGVQRD
jgi:(p)ppGpp synthase/HD superfamily hydrolase